MCHHFVKKNVLKFLSKRSWKSAHCQVRWFSHFALALHVSSDRHFDDGKLLRVDMAINAYGTINTKVWQSSAKKHTQQLKWIKYANNLKFMWCVALSAVGDSVRQLNQVRRSLCPCTSKCRCCRQTHDGHNETRHTPQKNKNASVHRTNIDKLPWSQKLNSVLYDLFNAFHYHLSGPPIERSEIEFHARHASNGCKFVYTNHTRYHWYATNSFIEHIFLSSVALHKEKSIKTQINCTNLQFFSLSFAQPVKLLIREKNEYSVAK